MLELSGVETFYGQIQALKGVDLKVQAGEMVTLIGANGAGKSTTLLSISGIAPCERGSITWQGEAIHSLPPWELITRGIIQVPEGRRIFSDFSVLENLKAGSWSQKKPEKYRQNLEKVCSYFPVLKERAKQAAGTLSGGEQQMLAIARALMGNPGILLLDEPSLGLAPLLVKKIFSIIKKINEEEKTTILLVEQNAWQALRLAHRAYVMENGKITLSGSGSELLNNPAVQKAYLGH